MFDLFLKAQIKPELLQITSAPNVNNICGYLIIHLYLNGETTLAIGSHVYHNSFSSVFALYLFLRDLAFKHSAMFANC